jgi:hypothetical protein
VTVSLELFIASEVPRAHNGERLSVVGAASFGYARTTWVCLRRKREDSRAVRAEGPQALGTLRCHLLCQLMSLQRPVATGIGETIPTDGRTETDVTMYRIRHRNPSKMAQCWRVGCAL